MIEDTTLKAASLPLTVTLQTFEKPEPLITTDDPTRPAVGENRVTLGFTLKPVVLEARPECVLTLIRPLVAFNGTIAMILL